MASGFLQDLFNSISDQGRRLILSGSGRALTSRGMVELVEAVLSEKGEATGAALSLDTVQKLQNLDDAEKDAFFDALATTFGADADRLAAAIAAYQADPSDANAVRLNRAAESRRQELLRRLHRAPGGTAALVALREDLLDRLGDNPVLAPVDDDFAHLLSSWFNRGFLVLERIDWSTPANILEKLIQYEAVHEIRNWADLRRRIEPSDRRCYAFFHPLMGDEPLIFVEVALTRKTPEAIAPILAAPDADRDEEILRSEDADTAVFFSISNCQRGLRGVSLGNFLIKQVVEELSRELPKLKTFVTLSPVPGFMAWLRDVQAGAPGGVQPGLTSTQFDWLAEGTWSDNPAKVDALEEALMPLAAYYFCHAKNRRGEPRDPVARFHLGNGARLERLCWLGDRSRRALRDGAGLMVNYDYDRQAIVENHERYVREGLVAASATVRRLARRIQRSETADTDVERTPATDTA